jgi:hypothetical protein
MTPVEQRIATFVLHDVRMWRYEEIASGWRALYRPGERDRQDILIYSNVGRNTYTWWIGKTGRAWPHGETPLDPVLIERIPEELFVQYITSLNT